jgi:Protein of unknown function (DUF3800)
MAGTHTRTSLSVSIEDTVQIGLMTFDPTAYCDESYRDHHVFVVAGYLAATDTWSVFNYIWNDALRDEGLREFHARDCQQGEGEFKGWTVSARQQTWRRFIEVIRRANVLGVVTAIDLSAYDEFAPSIKRMRHPGYGHAYFLAFQHQVEEMANQLASLDARERLAFVFDETDGFQGRARQLYDSLKRSESGTLPFVTPLGPLVFADSKQHAGLQAADVLAYESHRYFRDTAFSTAPLPERWQMELLRESRLVIAKGFNHGALQVYMHAIKAQLILALPAEMRDQLDPSELEAVPKDLRRGW